MIDIHHNAILMKNTVISAYGRDSVEAGYIRYVFAKRPTEYLAKVYDELMEKVYRR